MTDQSTPAHPSDKPVFDTVFIAPTEAIELLAKNTLNRTIREDHVRDMARDMLNNRWDLNGETIKISVDGDIIDGQHRLLAIIQAGVGIETAIATNLPSSVRYTVDTGRTRSNSDHFRMLGESDSTVLSAVLRGAWQYTNGRDFRNNRPTQRDLQAFLDEHPEARRSAEIGRRTNKKFRFLSRAAVGVAHFAILQVDTEMVPEFFTRVEEGTLLDTGNPILALRNRAMSDRESRLALSLSDQVGYLVHTWNRWLGYIEAGKPLYQLRFPLGSTIPTPHKPRQLRQEELSDN